MIGKKRRLLGAAALVTTAAALLAGSAAAADIVETAQGAGNFNTLVAAVDAAGLTETLQGGDYTVLAPTDEAFEALGQDRIDELLADPQGELTDILQYHVIDGSVPSSEIADGQEVATLNGAVVTFGKDDEGNVTVNGATVVAADVGADNGVIHAIDQVLTPEAADGGAADDSGSNWWWWLLLLLIPLAALLYFLSRRKPAPQAPARTETRSVPRETAAPAAIDDDLTRLPGITSGLADLLKKGGIGSFAALAAASTGTLKGILGQAGLLDKVDPDKLKQSAQLAADGKWDDVKSQFSSLT
jgi:uncharacterized surface protein with fasciclin (FAS1) repeats/predicted flap endonuclease-1-like 5' DNA nuclease